VFSTPKISKAGMWVVDVANRFKGTAIWLNCFKLSGITAFFSKQFKNSS
jgi:hypothetical protein